ncbi:group I intron-associated PD-(D/E)XK endonuclease [Paraconexibacter sp. AEG42_29]|uniref:group I intron-associated PD-(D/E)XK endonuclease n=1 Tax=Paraconexibacter sp. AEG42_29 TaxID=2997339 RepID=UPI00339D595D
MATLKQKGDLAELKVAADLVAQGYRILLPFGEDHSYDLAIDDGGRLLRVQVKHTRSDGRVVVTKCFTHSLTNGKVRATTRYTSEHIDWLVVWDATTDRCVYIPAAMLGTGRSSLYFRYTETLNNQRRRIRWVDDHRNLATAAATIGLDFRVTGP